MRKAARGLRRWIQREWRDTRRMWLDIRNKAAVADPDVELESLVDGHGAPQKGSGAVAAAEASQAQAVKAVVGAILHDEASWRQAKQYGSLVAVVMLFEALLAVFYSKVQKDFNTCLERRDTAGFYRGIRLTFMLLAILMPVIGAHEFVAKLLARVLRAAFTMRLARLYLSCAGKGCHCPFYRLQLTSDIDNPDQRICEDAHDAVTFIFDSLQELAGAVLGALCFSAVLLVQAPQIFLFILCYATAGSLAMALGFGPCISDVASQSVKQEATLRTQLVRVHEAAESVAFFDGGGAEWLRFQAAFHDLRELLWRRVRIFTGVDTFNRSYGFAVFAVVPLAVGPGYLRGEVEFGLISQLEMAFMVVFTCLSLILLKAADTAVFLVSIRRLHLLEEALCAEQSECGRIAASAELPEGGALALRLQGLTLRTPPRAGTVQQTLVDGLSLQLQGGQSLMIAGVSGVGKSSLLRAVAGLWSDGDGRIELQPANATFFLPQKPYMVLGSLRQQLLYPDIQRQSVEDSKLEEALRQVNLGYLLSHHSLSDRKEWATLLSPGEQQRINFARAYLREDLQLTLVDEGTSACDPRNEADLYELLKRCSRSYISVGHRQALLRHHSLVLWLRRSPTGPGERPGAATAEVLPAADFLQVCGLSEWAE